MHHLGVLGICKHGLPATHVGTYPRRCAPLEENQSFGLSWEPFAAWRHYIEKAIALLNVCARLRENEAGKRQDWSLIFDSYGPVVACDRIVRFDSDSGSVRVDLPPPIDG